MEYALSVKQDSILLKITVFVNCRTISTTIITVSHAMKIIVMHLNAVRARYKLTVIAITVIRFLDMVGLFTWNMTL